MLAYLSKMGKAKREYKIASWEERQNMNTIAYLHVERKCHKFPTNYVGFQEFVLKAAYTSQTNLSLNFQIWKEI